MIEGKNFTFTETERNYNISYLGEKNFFITIGNYNEIILRYNYINGYAGIIMDGPSDYPSFGPFNHSYEPVNNFNTWSNKNLKEQLKEFSEPIQATISVEEGSSIYLKVPKLMAGSNNVDFGSTNEFTFITPIQDSPISTMLAEIESEITSTVNAEDFLYIRDNDVFEQSEIGSPLNTFPVSEVEYNYKGNLYIKLAEISYDENDIPTIKYFWTSNVICPNRYSSANIRLWRNINILVGVSVKWKNVNRWNIITLRFSRPDFLIKKIDDIKGETESIANDVRSYIQIWGNDERLDYSTVTIREITAIYFQTKNSKPILEIWDSNKSDPEYPSDLIYDQFSLEYNGWFQE